MTRMSDGTFRPNENLCRAQFALILHRMSGEPENDRNSGFPDISPSDWYAEAVTWAVRSGVGDRVLWIPDCLGRHGISQGSSW